uniref:Anaphase-promoting complex subunit 11 n=1 Tax=Chlamydomonas leiostraca TaxID=1034604 RepID=A0A7S0S693_9CHLO|mmetsp:Transcript_7872/g.19658  ORF Transcript_7872/g.19658 Transcript_7872/m.19658 type:complete len:109 (+) Transcript_7872:3-329(+)
MTFTVTIKRWHGVAAWTWNAGDDVCGICRMAFDGCPPDGKYPGDDSPVVWGVCCHAFHIQCIQKWLASSAEQRCPMCRRAWEYKSANEEGGAQPMEVAAQGQGAANAQ